MNFLPLVLSALVPGLGAVPRACMDLAVLPPAMLVGQVEGAMSSVAPAALVAPAVRATWSGPASLPAAKGTGDPWLGEDKARHLFMSFALTTLTFGAARVAGLDAHAAMPVAAGVTVVAGVGKELHDERSGRFFSFRDLAYDMLGLGLGLTLAAYTR